MNISLCSRNLTETAAHLSRYEGALKGKDIHEIEGKLVSRIKEKYVKYLNAQALDLHSILEPELIYRAVQALPSLDADNNLVINLYVRLGENPPDLFTLMVNPPSPQKN